MNEVPDLIVLVIAVALFGVGCGLIADAFYLPGFQFGFGATCIAVSIVGVWIGLYK